MKIILIISLVCLLGLGTGRGQQAESTLPKIDYEKMGEALLKAVMKGNLDEYKAILTASAANTLTPEALAQLRTELTTRLGTFTDLRMGEQQKTGQFYRVLYDCRFSKGTTTMIVIMENEEKIAGILFPDIARSKPVRTEPPPVAPPQTAAPASVPATRATAETKTPLRLPFSGKWKVANGGRDARQNGHAASRAEVYSYDFIMVGIDDRPFKTDGKKNEDYYAFEKELRAPADGVVVQAVDGIEDNVPGETNPFFPLGNLIILDHQNGEYSVLAHLAKGSIRVKEGQKVKLDEPLAQCGNSGDSPHPHVHYHLQDHARLTRANGVPVIFQHYYKGNKPVEKGTPEFNELISN